MNTSLVIFLLAATVLSVTNGGIKNDHEELNQNLALFIISAQIEKVEGDTIYLSGGKKAGFENDMVLVIHSFDPEYRLPENKTALAQITLVGEDKSTARITWRDKRSSFGEHIYPQKITIPINPGDMVIGRYYGKLSKEDLSRIEIIMGLDKSQTPTIHNSKFKPLAYVYFIKDKTVIEAKDKKLEAKLAEVFSTPYISQPMEVRVPNTKKFFESMFYPAILGMPYYDIRRIDIKNRLDQIKQEKAKAAGN